MGRLDALLEALVRQPRDEVLGSGGLNAAFGAVLQERSAHSETWCLQSSGLRCCPIAQCQQKTCSEIDPWLGELL